jgi:hypothetical protein
LQDLPVENLVEAKTRRKTAYKKDQVVGSTPTGICSLNQ